MSIRQSALPWLKSKNVSANEAIYTSKFYKPEESWPKKSVWWFVIPLKQTVNTKVIHLICQIAPDSNGFYYLRVPTTFFNDHLANFDKVHDSLHIYLSTDPIELFVELRGKGRLKFGQFLITNN
jgi:hypothetical protein